MTPPVLMTMSEAAQVATLTTVFHQLEDVIERLRNVADATGAFDATDLVIAARRLLANVEIYSVKVRGGRRQVKRQP